MFTAPELVEAKIVELFNQIEISFELQRWVFTDRVVRGKERSETKCFHDPRLERPHLRGENDEGRRKSDGPRFEYLVCVCGVRALESPDVLCFLAFAAGGNVEFYALTLVQGFVALTDDVREVHEYVVSTLTGNKPEALLCVEELHCTCRHDTTFAFNDLALVV